MIDQRAWDMVHIWFVGIVAIERLEPWQLIYRCCVLPSQRHSVGSALKLRMWQRAKSIERQVQASAFRMYGWTNVGVIGHPENASSIVVRSSFHACVGLEIELKLLETYSDIPRLLAAIGLLYV